MFWACKSLNQLRLTDLVGNICLLLSQILSHLELGGLVGGVVSAYALQVIGRLLDREINKFFSH